VSPLFNSPKTGGANRPSGESNNLPSRPGLALGLAGGVEYGLGVLALLEAIKFHVFIIIFYHKNII
jgi:hypothetical protein